MNLLLVLNPNAASGRARKTFPLIRRELAARGIRFEALPGPKQEGAIQSLDLPELGGFDGIVAVGGDGTVFQVVNGLYRKSPEDRIPLGVIPVGTGNAFARDLGLMHGAWDNAARMLAEGRTRKVDVGRVTTPGGTFHFINALGQGFVADVAGTAHTIKSLGRGAYTMATLWCTLNLKFQTLVADVDGRRIEQENVFVEISNTRFTGTSFMIAPDARMDDGMLDVTLLGKLPRARLLRLFPTVYSGRHVDFEEISTIQARNIKILEPESKRLIADGEFHGETPAEIQCLHRELAIFC